MEKKIQEVAQAYAKAKKKQAETEGIEEIEEIENSSQDLFCSQEKESANDNEADLSTLSKEEDKQNQLDMYHMGNVYQ